MSADLDEEAAAIAASPPFVCTHGDEHGDGSRCDRDPAAGMASLTARAVHFHRHWLPVQSPRSARAVGVALRVARILGLGPGQRGHVLDEAAKTYGEPPL